MTTNHKPASYLAFANIQIAAEAFLTNVIGDQTELTRVLKSGNKFNSRFPTALAEEFSQKFKVPDYFDSPGRVNSRRCM